MRLLNVRIMTAVLPHVLTNGVACGCWRSSRSDVTTSNQNLTVDLWQLKTNILIWVRILILSDPNCAEWIRPNVRLNQIMRGLMDEWCSLQAAFSWCLCRLCDSLDLIMVGILVAICLFYFIDSTPGGCCFLCWEFGYLVSVFALVHWRLLLLEYLYSVVFAITVEDFSRFILPIVVVDMLLLFLLGHEATEVTCSGVWPQFLYKTI